jgi:hypothetical protein
LEIQGNSNQFKVNQGEIARGRGVENDEVRNPNDEGMTKPRNPNDADGRKWVKVGQTGQAEKAFASD